MIWLGAVVYSMYTGIWFDLGVYFGLWAAELVISDAILILINYK